MALSQLVEQVVAQLRETPVDLSRLAPRATPGALFSGAAGVAFFLCEAGRSRGEDDLVRLARRWCTAGRRWVDQATSTDWKGRGDGLLVGEAGLVYVETFVAAREDDAAGALRAVERMERAPLVHAGASSRPTDLAAGAAGVACGARALEAQLPAARSFDGPRALLARIRERSVGVLLESHEARRGRAREEQFGFADGLAGELWTLVQLVGADHALVKSRLLELEALREIDEHGFVYWFPSGKSRDTAKLGAWCSGVAGQSLLWSAVADQRRDKASMRLARRAADMTNLLLAADTSLCCGLAGQALALQSYADVAGDPLFTRRAYERILRAAQIALEAQEDYRLDLSNGTLGVALVALRRLHGERGFPCVEAARAKTRAPGADAVARTDTARCAP